MATTKRARYRIRKIGNRHDYIRRYAVLDPVGRRVDNVRGGLTEPEARDMADELNARHGLLDPPTTAPTTPLYLLLAGEYADVENVGVTFALTQEEADRTADILTAERAKPYRRPDGREARYPSDLIRVRAEPIAVITPSGETLT